MFTNPVLLSQVNISFGKSIVSGKSITELETRRLVDELHKVNEETFRVTKDSWIMKTTPQ
jgi:hypothetical protein